MFESAGASWDDTRRHIVQNVLLIAGLLGSDPIGTVLDDEIVFGRTWYSVRAPIKGDFLQFGEQTHRKRHARVVGDRTFDDPVALPIDPNSVLHDLDRGVEPVRDDFDIAPVSAKRFDRGRNVILAKVVQADDRAEVQIVIPRNQCLISNSAETRALAKKKDYTL